MAGMTRPSFLRSSDLGFVKGHKYEVLATRIVGGKEKVYARATMTLK